MEQCPKANWGYTVPFAVHLILLGFVVVVEQAIRSHLSAIDGECAVAFRVITGPPRALFIRAETPFHAASTMKTPVMVEVYRQADEDALALDDTLRVENDFRSIADGSRYSLDAADDSHQTLYEHLGERCSIRSLVRDMIVASSNLATNLLIEHVGPENVTRTMRHLGAEGIRVRRGVEDPNAFDRGLNNETTARGLLVLFERIARGTAVSEAACSEMIEILTDQQHTDMIPAHLPDWVDVAHKTGWISGVRHDSGIVFVPEGPTYVLVLLSRDLSDVDAGVEALANISRRIFDEVGQRFE